MVLRVVVFYLWSGMEVKLKKECEHCSNDIGYTKNDKNHVYCSKCNKWQYCATNKELGKKEDNRVKRKPIPDIVRVAVFMRANGKCELCFKEDSPLEVAHLVPIDTMSEVQSRYYTKNDKDAYENVTFSEKEIESVLGALCHECNSGQSNVCIPLNVYLAILKRREVFKNKTPEWVRSRMYELFDVHTVEKHLLEQERARVRCEKVIRIYAAGTIAGEPYWREILTQPKVLNAVSFSVGCDVSLDTATSLEKDITTATAMRYGLTLLYVGPWAKGDKHGCAVGSRDDAAVHGEECSSNSWHSIHSKLFRNAVHQIGKCDLFTARIDRSSEYLCGTLVEVGIALSMGKPIMIDFGPEGNVVDNEARHDFPSEMWFAAQASLDSPLGEIHILINPFHCRSFSKDMDGRGHGRVVMNYREWLSLCVKEPTKRNKMIEKCLRCPGDCDHCSDKHCNERVYS